MRIADQDFALRRLLLGFLTLFPGLLAELAMTIRHLLLARIELGLLLRRQNVADLVHLLSANRLGEVACALHVSAERRGITLLTSRTGSGHQTLLLCAKRLERGLGLSTDRLNRGFVGIG